MITLACRSDWRGLRILSYLFSYHLCLSFLWHWPRTEAVVGCRPRRTASLYVHLIAEMACWSIPRIIRGTIMLRDRRTYLWRLSDKLGGSGCPHLPVHANQNKSNTPKGQKMRNFPISFSIFHIFHIYYLLLINQTGEG